MCIFVKPRCQPDSKVFCLLIEFSTLNSSLSIHFYKLNVYKYKKGCATSPNVPKLDVNVGHTKCIKVGGMLCCLISIM